LDPKPFQSIACHGHRSAGAGIDDYGPIVCLDNPSADETAKPRKGQIEVDEK
ncbi:MAG: hypothetical protein JRI71_07765, partial [Deltaproteobacteria bacterium]|nr:hypothetical protein [Deltaproteobacteria bacterium]